MEKIYKSYILFVIILIAIFCIIYIIKSKSNNEISYVMDELEIQYNLEKNFTTYDYTFSNMNIIMDPYNVSPLTALVMFKTENNEKIMVTIKGKYGDDFKYNYKENYNHSIIIYGLYADYNNEVLIEGESFSKTIYLKTKTLPKNLEIIEGNIGLENNLRFISSNYLYAIDSNNEVRWLLNNSNSGNVSITKDNSLVIGTNRKINNISYTGVQEINLLGKIYYEYYIKYNGLNRVDNNYIYVNNYLIDRQTGEIKFNKDSIVINNKDYLSENNNNVKFKKGIRFGKNKVTNNSNKDIILFNYKKLPKKYKIKMYKEFDRMVLNGEFDDKSYLILDKLFNKKIYKLKNGNNYINSSNLNGKYNIYIKLNDQLYKTNKYVQF